MIFADSAEMAKQMDTLAAKYPLKKTEGDPALPGPLTPGLGLIVAASEKQPLVVVLAEDAKRREELEAQVAKLAWDKAIEGRFTYSKKGMFFLYQSQSRLSQKVWASRSF